MHKKRIYSNKSHSSIQGLRSISKSLPYGLKTVLKKGGHNYSSIINNWTSLVGKKVADICYPKSVKSGRELKNGVLLLNVAHGDQLTVEYKKGDIIEKINSYFGYDFIKEVKLVLIKEQILKKEKKFLNEKKYIKMSKKIDGIKNLNTKEKLKDLISAFGEKGGYND